MGPVASSPHSLGVLQERLSTARTLHSKGDSLDDLVKVVSRHRSRRLRCLGQSATFTRLTNRPSDQTRPTVLMVGTKSASVIAVEELVEEQVVSEVRVAVQLGVSAVTGSSALFVTGKDVDQPMLDLFSGASQ
jgi:hypothetical protein